MCKFLQIFLLNPNFILAHSNRYSEGTDNGQKTPLGHPNFNSYVQILRVLVFQTDGWWTNGQIDRWGYQSGGGWVTTFLQVNSLTAIDGHDRQYFNELRSTVVSRRIFIRLQSLIAR